MESTKAKIQGVVQHIYDSVVEAIPKDVKVDGLDKEEEVEGFFAVFFTSKGDRGMAVGVLDQNAVMGYLDEVLYARHLAMQKGKNIVEASDIDAAREQFSGT